MFKIIRQIGFFLVILLHLLFIMAIFIERTDNLWILGFIGLTALLISVSYYNAPKEEEAHFVEDAFVILFVITGGLATYCLNINLNIGPVLAASLVGLLASFIPFLKINTSLVKEVPEATYCGAFVGMTAPQVATDIKFILFASFMTGAMFLLCKNVFNGFGGKLGTIAFGGVAVTYFILFLLF
ncbi:MAG: hypothetical protein V7767_08385 [Leeuwenhoekiella sp.]